MTKPNQLACECGHNGETRVVRLVDEEDAFGNDFVDATSGIIESLQQGLYGIQGIQEMEMTSAEHGSISLAATVLDHFLVNLGFLPRALNSGLYHILSDSEFDRELGHDVYASVKLGHAYFRQNSDDAQLINRFLASLFHETVHLSAALRLRIGSMLEQGRQRKPRVFDIRDGLHLISGSQSFFSGLNEAVTDYAADIVATAAFASLDLLERPDQTAKELHGFPSVYNSHIELVDRVCKGMFPESAGQAGWSMLLHDYWGGTDLFFPLLLQTNPWAYAVLRDMGVTAEAAAEATRLLSHIEQ